MTQSRNVPILCQARYLGARLVITEDRKTSSKADCILSSLQSKENTVWVRNMVGDKAQHTGQDVIVKCLACQDKEVRFYIKEYCCVLKYLYDKLNACVFNIL